MIILILILILILARSHEMKKMAILYHERGLEVISSNCREGGARD